MPLIRDVTDRALLGIHEAIPLPADSAADCSLSVELPTYVPRDIDADLRTALEARSRTGGFVLLVGPAASGKTRCAYEAIRTVLPRWRLFMPGDASTLTELVNSGTDLRHSVLWLNETRDFLTGPDRLKPTTVRRLLADTASPTILIGTIWPTTYDQLRIAPDSTENDGSEEGEDLNRDAAEVLSLARRFSLGAWSDPEWGRAEELITLDPRIGQATRHRGQTGLTQILSAAPELIHRWEQADSSYGQTVITAAVVARRCGHPAVVTAGVIGALAQEFLSGAQRAAADEGWLTDAITWACRPVHHTAGIAPLQAVGEAIGEVDGYQVSDILVDHKSASAPISEHRITASVWRRLVELATPRACLSIGAAAFFADMREEAALAWRRAADVGSIEAAFPLGLLLREEGDIDGARAWLQRAADANHLEAMASLGNLLRVQGDTDGARTWWQRAADAGNTSAMNNLGLLLRGQGDTDDARTWWQRAANANHTNAMASLGHLLSEQGDTDGARTWWQRAADAGNTSAMNNLGLLLRG
ncbi:tetratricopeptide repeat protein, partial [Streptomyces sp. NPDC020800]|uniref:tetratricopeptide repeat protein n=1 Tax=Streptomyces sp. NPDC020800 TaxID=3365092 RepID=UPI0037924663